MLGGATGGGPSLPRNHVEEHAVRLAAIQPHAGADKNVHRPALAVDKISSTASVLADKNCPTCKRCSVAVGGKWEKQARHGTAGHNMDNSVLTIRGPHPYMVCKGPFGLKLCPSKIIWGPKKDTIDGQPCETMGTQFVCVYMCSGGFWQ